MPPTIEEPKAKADVEKPAEVKPAEEPGAAADSFIQRLSGGLNKKKSPPAADKPADEKPKDDKPKEDEKPKADAAKEDKPKEAAKPKAKAAALVEPPPTLDTEAIAQAAARGVASEFAKNKTQVEKPKPADATEGLSDDERETYDVLARMDAPTSVKYVQSTKNAKKYQAEWESRNAGKKFDPESPEHNEFFEENAVDWNETTFNRTLARMEAEKLIAEDKKKGNKELDELKQQNKLRDEEPRILAKKRATAKSFFTALGDDYKDIITEDGRVNMAEVKRLTEADPVKLAAFDAVESVEAFTGELYRLTNGLAEYDEKNPSHEFIGKFVEEQEVLLKSLPSDQQLDGRGRRFATSDEFNAMAPSKRAYYWKLSPDDVTEMYAAREAKLAQERISAEEKRIERIVTARGGTWKASDKAAESNGATKDNEDAAAVVEKPNSPAGTVEPRMALAPVNHGANGESKVSSFTRRFAGRS